MGLGMGNGDQYVEYSYSAEDEGDLKRVVLCQRSSPHRELVGGMLRSRYGNILKHYCNERTCCANAITVETLFDPRRRHLQRSFALR